MRERPSPPEPTGIETRSALLDAIRGVKWPSRRAAAGALPGSHPSRLRGSAPELSEYRVYRQGDDPKRIDWRLLARSDRAYIRLAEDRSVVPTMLVVDATASMAFPPRSLAKWRLASDLAVGLAAVAHASRDPVGLIVVSGRERRVIPARTRRGIVGEIARALEGMSPEGNAPLTPALTGIASRTRIAIVSDFLGDADDLRRRAGEVAAAGGEVHALHIVASEELDPPARAVLAIDPEQPTVMRPFVADARAAYLEEFGRWRESLAAAWKGDALAYVLATTDEPASRIIRRVAGGPAGVTVGVSHQGAGR